MRGVDQKEDEKDVMEVVLGERGQDEKDEKVMEEKRKRKLAVVGELRKLWGEFRVVRRYGRMALIGGQICIAIKGMGRRRRRMIRRKRGRKSNGPDNAKNQRIRSHCSSLC